MTIEQIRKFHEARPFLPFDIVMADGDKLRVPHPEWLAHPGKGRTVVVFDPDGLVQVVDMLLVTRLDIRSGARRRSNGGNGRGRGR